MFVHAQGKDNLILTEGPDLIWAQRALGKTLPKALKFKPSFVVFVLMERFQNKKNGSGRVGRHYIVGKYVVAKVSFTGGRVDVHLKTIFLDILTLTAKRLCDFTIKTLP